MGIGKRRVRGSWTQQKCFFQKNLKWNSILGQTHGHVSSDIGIYQNMLNWVFLVGDSM